MKLLSRIRVTEHPEQCFAVVVIGIKIEMLVALTEQEIFFLGAFGILQRMYSVCQWSANKMPSTFRVATVRI